MEGNYLEHPVFICGHRKTGTTMVINLFDNAKDAVVYPDDSSFFYMYYPRYDTDKYTKEQKLERLADVVIKEILTEVIENAKCSDEEMKELYKSQAQFYQLVKNYDKQDFTTKEILPYFIESFRKSFYPENKCPKIWIEKTTSTEVYALDLIEIFPNAKFIHIVRDPRDNWASLKSGWDKRYKDFNDDLQRLMHSLLERGKLCMEFAKYNLEIIGEDRYKVIKYEEITKDLESFMHELAQFIGIDFDSNLLIPTTFGYSWFGNNFDGIQNVRPSDVNVNRWKERINEEEAQLVEYYFRDIMQFFNYKLEYEITQAQKAAVEHYKWYNFSTPFSAK